MGRWTAKAQWAFLGILPLFLVLAALRLVHYRDDMDFVLQDQAEQFRVEYATILQCLEVQARFAFDESVDRPRVLAEVQAGWHAPDEARRAVHRDSLQAMLAPTWANLQEVGFRHFHFHFPDVTSFLRVHRPELFGDSLTEVRATVVAANRDQAPLFGFEEGRISNAYRCLFPLFHDGEHVGSVEISFSLLGIRKTLEGQMGGRHQLIMSREVVDRKLFTDARSNYADWPWSDRYVLDTAASNSPLFPEPGPQPQRDDLKRKITAGLQTGRDFSLPLHLGSRWYILQFAAIDNFDGQQVAYWVSLHESEALEDLRWHLRLTTSVYLLAILLLLGALFVLYRLQRKLKEAESFLPVCAACKKVRLADGAADESPTWVSLESFLAMRTEERITHGLCPECYRQAMRENGL